MKSQRTQPVPDSRLPVEVRDLFAAVWAQVAELHASWRILSDLFTGDPIRVALLKETAPAFFLIVRRALQDAMVLRIARLTDPAKQGAFENISLAALFTAVQSRTDPRTATSLASILVELKNMSKPVRTRRNRVVAHLDKPTILLQATEPLPGVSREQFEQILEQMCSFLNRIEVAFGIAESHFGHVVMHGDVTALVFHLEQALATLRKQEAAERGTQVPR